MERAFFKLRVRSTCTTGQQQFYEAYAKSVVTALALVTTTRMASPDPCGFPSVHWTLSCPSGRDSTGANLLGSIFRCLRLWSGSAKYSFQPPPVSLRTMLFIAALASRAVASMATAYQRKNPFLLLERLKPGFPPHHRPESPAQSVWPNWFCSEDLENASPHFQALAHFTSSNPPSRARQDRE